MSRCEWCGRPNCKQCQRERDMEARHGVPEDHLGDDRITTGWALRDDEEDGEGDG